MRLGEIMARVAKSCELKGRVIEISVTPTGERDSREYPEIPPGKRRPIRFLYDKSLAMRALAGRAHSNC